MSIVTSLEHLDIKISKWLHQKDNLFLTTLLYPFAAFFHPGLIWIAYLSIFYFSGQNIKITAVYALGTLLCLLTIFILKKMFKRARPELNVKAKKPHHFRKKQKNNAMPSGDAIQSALFVTFLYYLGLPLAYLCLFHLAVCLGRVYYMCHWVADTMVATLLGLFLGQGLVWLIQQANAFNFLNEYTL